jgi:hypothetical protein
MAKATLGVFEKEKLVPKGINVKLLHICITGFYCNTIVFYIPQFGNSGPHFLYCHANNSD